MRKYTCGEVMFRERCSKERVPLMGDERVRALRKFVRGECMGRLEPYVGGTGVVTPEMCNLHTFGPLRMSGWPT